MEEYFSRFITGALFGGLVVGVSGTIAVDVFGPTLTINGLVVAAFVAVVSGLSCVIGGISSSASNSGEGA